MRPRTLVDLVEPATKVDPYSQQTVPDWSVDPTVHADVPAAVEPQTTDEAVGSDTVVSSGLVCYLPAETTLGETWRVRWLGDEYVIDGDVQTWVGARASYKTVTLRKVGH